MKSKHGATWWSGRFLRSLERRGMTTRLRRGHAFFEAGRVVDFEVEAAAVKSIVRDGEEYQCQIFFEPLSSMEWTESLDRLAFQDLSAAALLTTGRMPPQIEEFLFEDRRRIFLLGQGRPVNLSAGDGNPIEVMDLGLALQTLSLKYIVANGSNMRAGPQNVPESVEQQVSALAFEAWK